MRHIALIPRLPALPLQDAERARLQIDRHFAIDRLPRNRRENRDSYESTQAAQVAGFPQRIVAWVIGTKNRNERHLTNVDGINAASRADSGSYGANQGRDSQPNASSLSRRNDQSLPGRRTCEKRRNWLSLAHLSPPGEAAIEHSQRHGALAFTATEHGSGPQRAIF